MTLRGSRIVIFCERRRATIFAFLALWLVALSLCARINHDESQYAIAAALSTEKLIFRDFLSHQPPVHAWLYAPLFLLFKPHAFVAMRIATALTALATLWIIYRVQRQLLVPVGAAVFSVALMASCATFQFTAAIIRNDMLPAMFASAGLWALLRAFDDGNHHGHRFLSGLFFALAAATKLSFVPIAAIAMLIGCWQWGRSNLTAVAAMAVGMAAGCLPALIAFLLAPDAFIYGVLQFNATAPFQWHRETGNADQLTLIEKFKDIVKILAYGPALIAFILVVVYWLRSGICDRTDKILAALLAAAFVGAALPTPTYLQYLLPILPFLFTATGRIFARHWPGRIGAVLLACFAVAGIAYSAIMFGKTLPKGVTALVIDQQEQWIGDQITAHGASGDIATFAPQIAMDSGYEVDERFSTGPFMFRSAAMLSPQQARRLDTFYPATFATDLAARPPAAIITGYEKKTGKRPSLDIALIDFAHAHGYLRLAMPDGRGTLFIHRTRAQIRPRRGNGPPHP